MAWTIVLDGFRALRGVWPLNSMANGTGVGRMFGLILWRRTNIPSKDHEVHRLGYDRREIGASGCVKAGSPFESISMPIITTFYPSIPSYNASSSHLQKTHPLQAKADHANAQ